MIHKDLHASLMRFCQEFCEKFTAGVTPTFTNFDATWEEAELPQVDLMGYFALSYSVNGGIIEGTFQVGYSTREDTNLFRLNEAIAMLLEAVLPGNRIQILDATTGVPQGFFVVKDGTRVMPVIGSKNRPVQFVAVQFATTVTYQLNGNLWTAP